MTTARELLQQVDALMRRNREEAANADSPVPTDAEIPVLTDAVGSDDAAATDPPQQTSDAIALPMDRLAGHEARADAQRWAIVAEEIRMQVLQRIDIFTDTGLQEQLKARLQPIVDHASADLVATINQHVGQLLRSYVAEAIEREIEKWRQGSGKD